MTSRDENEAGIGFVIDYSFPLTAMTPRHGMRQSLRIRLDRVGRIILICRDT
jgi:hypothetical protein